MRKWMERLRMWHVLSLPLCFCSFVFLDYSFRLFYRFLGNTALLAPKPMVFTLCWSALLTALISLLPRLGRRIAMMLCSLFSSLLTIVHGAMYNVFGHLFSFADLNYAGDGAKFFSWSYLNLRKAFLLCVAVSILMMALAAFLTNPKAGKTKLWQRRVGALVISVLSVIPIAVQNNAMLPPEEGTMWWGDSYNPNAEPTLYKEFSDPNRCCMMTGLYQYTFRNFLVSFGFGEDHEAVERLNAYYETREVSGENDRTDTLADKNFMMVMMESIDTWLVTPEIMPNLYALSQEGVNFENFYTPLYLSAGTFNTEIISQTGMIPAPTGMASSAYSTNAFPLSLANQFKEAGYSVNSYHSSYPSIYSRGTIHENLGFAAYHDFEDMGMQHPELDSEMLNAYDQMTADEPFFSYIITYSGHGPYNEEMGIIAEPHLDAARKVVAQSGVTGSAENLEEYTRAIAHAMETDAFIGELIAELKADGKLDDTVLLFYADHYGKYMTDKEFLAQLKNIASGDEMELYHTPCFFYGGGLQAETVDKLCSTVDLVPTIVNLFGLSADCRYYAGDDIFGELGGVVPMPNYAFYDGETYYSADFAGETTEALSQTAAEIKNRMTASMDALRCDYFAYYEK